MRVTLARHRSPNLRSECQSIATRQLEALTVPSTHNVANNCIYFQSHLLVGTNSTAIDLMTMKDYFFSASATSNPPFVIVGCCDCRWLLKDLSIPRAPEYMSHKNIIAIHFHIWTWYNPIIGIFRACRGISMKILIYGRQRRHRHLISPTRHGSMAHSEMRCLQVW